MKRILSRTASFSLYEELHDVPHNSSHHRYSPQHQDSSDSEKQSMFASNETNTAPQVMMPDNFAEKDLMGCVDSVDRRKEVHDPEFNKLNPGAAISAIPHSEQPNNGSVTGQASQEISTESRTETQREIEQEPGNSTECALTDTVESNSPGPIHPDTSIAKSLFHQMQNQTSTGEEPRSERTERSINKPSRAWSTHDSFNASFDKMDEEEEEAFPPWRQHLTVYGPDWFGSECIDAGNVEGTESVHILRDEIEFGFQPQYYSGWPENTQLIGPPWDNTHSNLYVEETVTNTSTCDVNPFNTFQKSLEDPNQSTAYFPIQEEDFTLPLRLSGTSYFDDPEPSLEIGSELLNAFPTTTQIPQKLTTFGFHTSTIDQGTPYAFEVDSEPHTTLPYSQSNSVTFVPNLSRFGSPGDGAGSESHTLRHADVDLCQDTEPYELAPSPNLKRCPHFENISTLSVRGKELSLQHPGNVTSSHNMPSCDEDLSNVYSADDVPKRIWFRDNIMGDPLIGVAHDDAHADPKLEDALWANLFVPSTSLVESAKEISTMLDLMSSPEAETCTLSPSELYNQLSSLRQLDHESPIRQIPSSPGQPTATAKLTTTDDQTEKVDSAQRQRELSGISFDPKQKTLNSSANETLSTSPKRIDQTVESGVTAELTTGRLETLSPAVETTNFLCSTGQSVPMEEGKTAISEQDTSVSVNESDSQNANVSRTSLDKRDSQTTTYTLGCTELVDREIGQSVYTGHDANSLPSPITAPVRKKSIETNASRTTIEQTNHARTLQCVNTSPLLIEIQLTEAQSNQFSLDNVVKEEQPNDSTEEKYNSQDCQDYEERCTTTTAAISAQGKILPVVAEKSETHISVPSARQLARSRLLDWPVWYKPFESQTFSNFYANLETKELSEHSPRAPTNVCSESISFSRAICCPWTSPDFSDPYPGAFDDISPNSVITREPSDKLPSTVHKETLLVVNFSSLSPVLRTNCESVNRYTRLEQIREECATEYGSMMSSPQHFRASNTFRDNMHRASSQNLDPYSDWAQSRSGRKYDTVLRRGRFSSAYLDREHTDPTGVDSEFYDSHLDKTSAKGQSGRDWTSGILSNAVHNRRISERYRRPFSSDTNGLLPHDTDKDEYNHSSKADYGYRPSDRKHLRRYSLRNPAERERKQLNRGSYVIEQLQISRRWTPKHFPSLFSGSDTLSKRNALSQSRMEIESHTPQTQSDCFSHTSNEKFPYRSRRYTSSISDLPLSSSYKRPASLISDRIRGINGPLDHSTLSKSTDYLGPGRFSSRNPVGTSMQHLRARLAAAHSECHLNTDVDEILNQDLYSERSRTLDRLSEQRLRRQTEKQHLKLLESLTREDFSTDFADPVLSAYNTLGKSVWTDEFSGTCEIQPFLQAPWPTRPLTISTLAPPIFSTAAVRPLNDGAADWPVAAGDLSGFDAQDSTAQAAQFDRYQMAPQNNYMRDMSPILTAPDQMTYQTSQAVDPSTQVQQMKNIAEQQQLLETLYANTDLASKLASLGIELPVEGNDQLTIAALAGAMAATAMANAGLIDDTQPSEDPQLLHTATEMRSPEEIQNLLANLSNIAPLDTNIDGLDQIIHQLQTAFTPEQNMSVANQEKVPVQAISSTTYGDYARPNSQGVTAEHHRPKDQSGPSELIDSWLQPNSDSEKITYPEDEYRKPGQRLLPPDNDWPMFTCSQNKQIPAKTPVKHTYDFPTKRILLIRDSKSRHNRNIGIGMQIVGGHIRSDGRLGAFVEQIDPQGPIDQLHGEINEGDEILEWNSIPLVDKSFEEVQSIIQQVNEETELLVRARADDSNKREKLSRHNTTHGDEAPVIKRVDALCHHHAAQQALLGLKHGPICPHVQYQFASLSSEDSFVPTSQLRNLKSPQGFQSSSTGSESATSTDRKSSSKHAYPSNRTEVLVETSARHDLDQDYVSRSQTARFVDNNGDFDDADQIHMCNEDEEGKGSSTFVQRGSLKGRQSKSEEIPEFFGEIELILTFDDYDQSLTVHIARARGLPSMDLNGLADPFVKVRLHPDPTEDPDFNRQTKYMSNTLAPEWQQTVVFMNCFKRSLRRRVLEVTVWDFDRLKTNDFMGQTLINLSDKNVLDGKPHWYPLHKLEPVVVPNAKKTPPSTRSNNVDPPTQARGNRFVMDKKNSNSKAFTKDSNDRR